MSRGQCAFWTASVQVDLRCMCLIRVRYETHEHLQSGVIQENGNHLSSDEAFKVKSPSYEQQNGALHRQSDAANGHMHHDSLGAGGASQLADMLATSCHIIRYTQVPERIAQK